MDEDIFGRMDREFDRADKIRKDKQQQFEKLVMDQCCDIPEVGDSVIVAAGLLNRGFDWIRLEAKVLAVAPQSYKVQFERNHYDGSPDIEWIHPAVVTDVIRQPTILTQL
ncbi:hypothetical protein M0R72_09215 [Candidatus Pacearchaeota archaeon]|jgi:hypothetical protein|nr:hypothetical protein [Candidatus Pacearchaeota archaeon]